MLKIYIIILYLLLLILMISSLCSLNLIGVIIYGVTFYGVINKKTHILKAWYIGHIISIIISLIISFVASVVLYVMIDVSDDTKEEYDENEFKELMLIYEVAKIVVIIAYIYTGLAILTVIYVRLYIKRNPSPIRHRREHKEYSNNSSIKFNNSNTLIEVSSTDSSSSTMSSRSYQLYINDRRQSQPMYAPPQQNRRLSQQQPPTRRQSQPIVRRVSLNNSFIQPPPRAQNLQSSQSPHHSQNSIKLHNARKPHQSSSLGTNVISNNSSSPSQSNSLNNLTPAPHKLQTSIPEDQDVDTTTKENHQNPEILNDTSSAPNTSVPTTTSVP